MDDSDREERTGAGPARSAGQARRSIPPRRRWSRLALGVAALAVGLRLSAADVIDSDSAAFWRACVGWVVKPPTTYGVSAEAGNLVFAATGTGTEMAWNLALGRYTVTGEERYLLIRYQALGLERFAGGYFLHGAEGTYGGRAYALATEIVADGAWQTLAVDLVAVQPSEPTHDLALKVIVGAAGQARLTVERIWFAEALPVGAQVAAASPRPALASTALDWSAQPLIQPQPDWTTTPAAQNASRLSAAGMLFRVVGQGRGMRWLVTLPQPVDLSRTSRLSLRYRASGDLSRETYAVWLGNQESGSGGASVIAVKPDRLQADGRWHTLQVEVNARFTAGYLAIGLDTLGETAELELGNLVFSSQPRCWTVAEVLAPVVAKAPWTPGAEGFTPLPMTVSGGQPSPFLGQRLDLADWFAATDIILSGVPFQVPATAAGVQATATGQSGELSLALSGATSEVYLLLAAAVPPTEPWGLESANPRPQESLAVPEKVSFEIRYAEGPPDQVLPLDAVSAQWGLARGLSVSVVHPDPRRQVTALVLREAMQTGSFGIVAATSFSGPPRVAEPDWTGLTYPALPAAPLAAARPLAASPAAPVVQAGVLQARFGQDAGLTWASLGVSGMDGALSCAAGPVFEVLVDGKVLPASEWQVTGMVAREAGRSFVVSHARAELRATVEVDPGPGQELRLRLRLDNTATTPVKATLRFPVLRDLALGAAADTWYLYGRRGGIINHVPARFRDPLGEPHPLQVDGFFNPRTGLALACLTHDTVAQHQVRNLAKTATGGAWSVEYPDRGIAPGQAFVATEASLVLREGDWRAILAAYSAWLATWFAPAVPRLPWFEETFAVCAANVQYDAVAEPLQRGAVQPLLDSMLTYIGRCDTVHLFGWGASKTYGDWGDYAHYDEIGGLEAFRGNIQRAQDGGIAVSLYLDGYLSCERGQTVGRHAKEWAMKRPDQSPQYIQEYDAYNECLSFAGWQEHVVQTCVRVQRETGARVLYIDEIGATDGRWICHATDHGHNAPEIPYAGEVALLRRIRAAVGPEVALYTEYAPAEVSRQYLDGSISYQALWSADMEPLAPHFIDLPRFVFPDFKQFHIIHYVGTRAGNWWLHKFPFFNGAVFRIGEPNLPGMDAASLAFLKQAVQVQCEHRAAFASHQVTPLVPTLQAGVFANLFSAPTERVWTLYNANGRGVRGGLLRVPHTAGARYADAWNGLPLQPAIRDGLAEIALDLGPKAIGCVVQMEP